MLYNRCNLVSIDWLKRHSKNEGLQLLLLISITRLLQSIHYAISQSCGEINRRAILVQRDLLESHFTSFACGLEEEAI